MKFGVCELPTLSQLQRLFHSLMPEILSSSSQVGAQTHVDRLFLLVLLIFPFLFWKLPLALGEVVFPSKFTWSLERSTPHDHDFENQLCILSKAGKMKRETNRSCYHPYLIFLLLLIKSWINHLNFCGGKNLEIDKNADRSP